MKKSTLFAIAASTAAVISLTTYELMTQASHMDASTQSEKVVKHVASKSSSSMLASSQKAKVISEQKAKAEASKKAQEQKNHEQEIAASNAAQIANNQQESTQQSDVSVSAVTSSTEPTQQTTQPSEVTPAPAPAPVQAPTRTDGMNFKGKHFDLQPFSGVNGEKTPSWTPYIFKWTALPNYYLAEEASAAGPATMSLSVGDEIVLDGRILHVSQVVPGMVRTQSMNLVTQLSAQHALGIQTCENPTGSIIRTVWAD